MATYQPGVTDYISQIQPTEPNLAFDAQILQTKQTKFDANHQKISELYGSILNSAMSRNENIEARDQFVKTINTDIVKMAGMDFSLDENVDAAANVFQSIYNNNNIVKDMVWTKNFQNQKARGQSLKNCIDPEKCGGQWWEQGDQYMDYKLKEFKDASNDESLAFENVEYIPYTNMTEKAMKYAKDNKLEITSDQLIGNYMVTTKNGPQAYGPLSELFTKLYSEDPKLLKQYEAQAYVNRKNNVGSIMSETGLTENEATAEYIRRQGNTQQEKINSILDQTNADEEYITDRMSTLEEKIKTGKFGKDSGVVKEYSALQQLLPGAQQASQYIKLAKMTGENSNDNTYVRNMASRLDTRDAALFMHADINGAAKTIADNTMTEKKEVDEIAKLGVAHQYSVMLEGVKQSNRVALESHKASLKNDESNPFGKGGKESKAVSDKTVNGYIDDAYKTKYGDEKVKGVYDQKIIDAKKVLETEVGNKTGDEYKKAAKDLPRLEAFNNESIRRIKAMKLDKSGTKPITGNSYGELMSADQKLSGRTAEDFKTHSKSSQQGISKTMGAIHGKLNGSNQEAHSEPEVNKKIAEIDDQKKIKPENIIPENVKKVKEFVQANQHLLSKEQKKYYDTLPANAVIPEKYKKKIAETVNRIEAANKATLKAKNNTKDITKEQVTQDTIQNIIDTHPDKEIVAKYKEIQKKGIVNLSDEYKTNIAKRYNKLQTNSMIALGNNTQSNVSTAESYRTHYTELNSEMHNKTAIVNKAYIDVLEKGSSEYKVLKAKALEYVKKHGEYKKDKIIASRWKGTGDPNTGITYTVGNQKIKDSGLTDTQLQALITNDSNFSNSLYKTVRPKIEKGTDKIKGIAKNAKVNNAMFSIDNIQEDFANHIKIKKDNHNGIIDQMKLEKGFDFPFNPDYVKNGFLVSFKEFNKTMQYRTGYDDDDAREEYQHYREAYHKGLDATITEKLSKDGKHKLSGVGPVVYPEYGADNVNMNSESNASDDVFSFFTNFNKTNSEDKSLFINGSEIVEPDQIRKYMSEIKRSKEFFNTTYKVQGAKNHNKDDKNDWEGMTLRDDKGWEYTFASNPKVKPSSLYIDKVISTKDKSLQQTGKTLLSSGNDYTNSEKVYVVKKKDGSLKFQGSVHIDGKNVDLNTLLYNPEKDYTHGLSSYEDAAAVFQDIMDDLEDK